MKSIFKLSHKITAICPLPMLIACCALLTLTPAVTLADRGRGSIRAAARPEPRAEEHREPVRVEPARAPVEVRHDVHVEPARHIEVPARRDWDDHDVDIRRGGGFAHGTPVRVIRGQRFHTIPHYVPIFFHNQNYFFDDDGNYYIQQNGDYVDVQPPVGAVVATLPPGVETIVAGPTDYYYLDGVFYVAQGNAFAVVNPPPGIVVPDLPSGANQVVINGNVFYQFSGFNYQASIQDGVTVYTVTPM